MTISERGGCPDAGPEQTSDDRSHPRAGPTTQTAPPGPAGPAARPRPAAPAGADGGAAPTSDPHRFGRVDPDGTVWLITCVRRTDHRLVAGR